MSPTLAAERMVEGMAEGAVTVVAGVALVVVASQIKIVVAWWWERATCMLSRLLFLKTVFSFGHIYSYVR